jgi:hypothetical protein
VRLDAQLVERGTLNVDAGRVMGIFAGAVVVLAVCFGAAAVVSCVAFFVA